MLHPPKLQAGDKVAIVAPARKITPNQLRPAINTLESWGLQPVLAEHIYSRGHSYLAGTDAERRRDFQAAIDDANVRAIFSARGGYGSTRIVDEIDFSAMHTSAKWIVGFSDVTAFHLRMASIGIATIHGTMPIFFGQEAAAESVERIRKILFLGSCKIESDYHDSNRLGHVKGTVIGGNLSLIVDALNTPSDPDTRNKILVIEEVDEYYYKLDRMLTQLRRSGKLKDLAGLLVGHMTDMKNSELDFGETVQQIVLHAVRDYAYPVAFAFPSGHRDPNLAWIHGGQARLDVTASGTRLIYPDIY